MHGNVAEWVLDQHTADFYGLSAGKVAANPLAVPKTLFPRIVRGGSWDGIPRYCRSAYRDGYTPDNRSDSFGFRVVVSLGGVD